MARIVGGRIREFVEPLLRVFEVVDADIKNQVATHGLAIDKQTMRAILLIGFGKDAANPHAPQRKGRAWKSKYTISFELARSGRKSGMQLAGAPRFPVSPTHSLRWFVVRMRSRLD